MENEMGLISFKLKLSGYDAIWEKELAEFNKVWQNNKLNKDKV